MNILGGLWVLYGVITGFFGDILSYIRLFALGVSSGILGFVINSIGQQFLSIKIVGPVIFIVFMLVGHALNIALGALSGFVHPLRLTFVEFFNNAGFNGPGMEYKPFGYKK
jgi:V/A-type H+-transporting ATPase subunit I